VKLMVAFPLYHQVPAKWFSHWLNMDRADVMGTSTVDGVYITSAMDMLVSSALEHDGWDRLVIYEADMLPPLDALCRAARYAPECDVVGSMYFRHEPPHNAVVYVEDRPSRSYDPITAATVKAWCDDPGVYRCDAVGFGFTTIGRRLLENWDPDVPMFSLDNTFGSHDLWFCHHARWQGFGVFVDSGVCCGHLTLAPVTLIDNQRCADSIDYELIIPFSYENT
jgi:hypothetical protein